MLDSLNADYVRTARAKGVPRRNVVMKHALRNALIPFVTVVAIDADPGAALPLEPVAAAYVLFLAIGGPLLSRFVK
jgi:ABC-type antimicrobial peptide transport system permease subunit